MSNPETSPGQGGAEVQQTPEIAPIEERRLEGKIILLTGGTSQIGMGIAQQLMQEGAIIVAPHITPRAHKERELAECAQQHETSIATPIIDITDPEQRELLINGIAFAHGGIDYIFHNAAAGAVADEDRPDAANQVNAQAPYELTRLALPFMRRGGGVFDEQSEWSLKYRHIEQLPGYEPVAATKHEGSALLHSLIPDLEKAGVRYNSICAHGVEGTTVNRVLAKRRKDELKAQGIEQTTEEVLAELGTTAEGGKFPTIAEFAQAALELTVNQYPQGYVRYVGVRTEEQENSVVPYLDQTETSRRLDIYGPEAVMLNDITIYGGGRRAIGHMKAEGDRVRPILTDKFVVDKERVGHYVVTHDDTRGHFRDAPKEELRELFQGIKMLALARRTANNPVGDIAVPVAFESITFQRAVYPEEILQVRESIIDGHYPVLRNRAEVLTESGDTVATVEQITHKVVMNDPEYNEGDVDPEYFIEAAAQAALLTGLYRQGIETMEGLSPLFSGIKRVVIHRTVPEGTNVTVDVTTTGEGKGIAGSAHIYDENGPIMDIEEMSGPVGKRRVMMRMADRTRTPSE